MIRADVYSNNRTSRRNLVAVGVVLSAMLTSAPSFAVDPTPAGVVSMGSLSFPDWGGMWTTFSNNAWESYLILAGPNNTYVNAPWTGGNIIFRGANTGGLSGDPDKWNSRGWIDSASVLHIKGVTTESGALPGGEGIRARAEIGVHGISTSTALNPGVFGEGMIGVLGQTSASNGVGVWGEGSNGGAAALFQGGEVRIQGGPLRPVNVPSPVNLGTSSARFGAIFLSTQPDVGSDVRLKKDIQDLPHGLSDVLKLHPVSYKLKSGPDDSKQFGLIAQEVDKVIPDVVVHGKDPSDHLSMRYEALIPVLIKAIQEQQARISDLEKRQQPVAASFFPFGLGGGVAIGLVPLGLAAVLGRRKAKNTRRGNGDVQAGDE